MGRTWRVDHRHAAASEAHRSHGSTRFWKITLALSPTVYVSGRRRLVDTMRAKLQLGGFLVASYNDARLLNRSRQFLRTALSARVSLDAEIGKEAFGDQ